MQKQRNHLWGLWNLSLVLNWQEELLAILNGPFLMAAVFISSLSLVVSFINPGGAVGWTWAALVLLGVDVQFIACPRRAKDSTGWTRVGWWCIAALLAIPMLQTVSIFSIRLQTNITEMAAMQQIGLTPLRWGYERAVLLVLLAAISALNRPHIQQPLVAVEPAPTPATPPPTAPDKPRSSKPPTTRRNTGRTVEETEALKRLVTPKVVALRNAGTPYQAIADQLDITKFMVQQILKDDKRAATTQEVA